MHLLKTALAGLALFVTGTAWAQHFAGHDVTMIVNYTAGGPTDIEARMVAQFLPKHLKGVRSIVVLNVGGAGGNIGVNQLGASDDKYTFGFFTWDPVDQIVENKALRVKYNDLKFVAGFQQVALTYARNDTKPGLKKPADIVKSPLVRVGALSPSNHQTTRMRLAFDLLGVNYELIPGYRGLRDIEMAVHQGDINVAGTSLPGWYATVKPNMADSGIVMPLFQFDSDLGNGKLDRNPDLPDMPSFLDVYRDAKGANAMPSGQRWESMLMLGRIMDAMYRTVFMTPAASPEAVHEMRQAFEGLAKDSDFIAQYERIVKTKPRVLVGEKGEDIIGELGRISPSQLAFLRDYVEAAR
ncbi:hypothetical protein [Bordetella sp. BOR01]|uniref:hypothetical protein n=1 Tax=Bordetella sp. BOR01 TaxID=2854779 RepID=UPI001C481182|nr:hypothetical protein [Bordetella sp. BOR01]MBV7484896.1 hypothetical protein [Bordetella sp. BOR01]